MSGTVGHSFAFSGKLPSTCGVNTPFVGAHWRVHRQSQKLLSSQKDPYFLLISAVVFLHLEYFSYLEPPLIYVFPLIGQEYAPWYI